MQDELGGDGLVVLALSNEEPGKVADYIDQMGINVRVASGSNSSPEYGVKGIPASCLIGPDGKVVWFGSPYSLSSGTVKDALKGAKPFTANFLAIRPSEPQAGKLAAIAKSMEGGKLGKALSSAKAIEADEKATAEEKAGAAKLAVEIDAHLTLLEDQSEAFIKSRDLLNAVKVYDALAKELAGLDAGNAAKTRLDEIKKDATLSKELAAAEAFEKVREQAAKLGSSKARDKFKEFASKYKGTRAGERAANMSRKKD